VNSGSFSDPTIPPQSKRRRCDGLRDTASVRPCPSSWNGVLQTIQRISKSVIVAEKEYRTAKSVSDPIETALADAKRRLEESMGANKLGSILELEDLDAITSKETEMVQHFHPRAAFVLPLLRYGRICSCQSCAKPPTGWMMQRPSYSGFNATKSLQTRVWNTGKSDRLRRTLFSGTV
jgi:hypothetical protein